MLGPVPARPMAIAKKTPTRRRPPGRTRSSVDPTRLALAAVERLKSILLRSGRSHKLAGPASMKELAARGQVLGQMLPPSYTAALRVAATIGEPELLLDANEMRSRHGEMKATKVVDAERYVPFARVRDRLICFDREPTTQPDAELPVVEWNQGRVKLRAHHFGEWLDEVADSREDTVVSQAAMIPASLKGILLELGFRFDDPARGPARDRGRRGD